MSDPFAGEDFWRGDPFGPFREDNAPPPSLRALLTDPRKRPEDEHEYDASIPPFLWAPPPVLATMDPDTTQEGSTVAVTVTGSGFILSSVVHAGTTALPTVYVSDTELTATYTPSAPGVVDVTVRNGTRVSNSLPFTVSAIPPPTVTTLAPDSSNLSTTTTVVVTGTNYTSASVVHADGVALPTTYTSATSLSAQYTSPATVGEVAFTVHDGPRVSNAVTFTVEDVFTPDKVPGLVAWWDATDEATFTYSADAEISEWANKLGGWPFTQSVITQQPARYTAGQNGLPVILYNPALAELLTNALAMVRPFTLYFGSHSYAARLIWWSSSSGIYWSTDTGNFYFGGPQAGPVTPADWEPLFYTFSQSGSSPGLTTVYRNGVAITGGVQAGENLTNLFIGGTVTDFFESSLFEVLLYTGQHDSTTQATVQQYLRDKWGTP
jgi:hypothetical protein